MEEVFNKNDQHEGSMRGSIKKDEKPESQGPIVTTTKNALITTPLNFCEATHSHRVKVSIVGIGNVGIACAVAILMKRMASEVCLIDKNAVRAEAEAEDIRHAGIFLGNPLIIGTSAQDHPMGSSGQDTTFTVRSWTTQQSGGPLGDITMVKESAVVIIAIGEPPAGERPNIRHNLEIFRIIIPKIAKFACRSVLVVVTRPIEVMSYVTWRLSKFPSPRVLGPGTLVDTMRYQYHLSKKLGLANTSVYCMSIGAQDASVWQSFHVAGTKLHEINPKMGESDDLEKWHEVTSAVNEMESKLANEKGEKGPSCWCLALCTAEIVDAILRNTKVVLPVATYIQSCSHGTDKDVYMSVPCVLGSGGVHHMVRHKLTEHEKSAFQACADGIQNVLRECGILQEPHDDNDEVS